GGFGLLDRKSSVAVVEAKQDVTLADDLRVDHRHFGHRGGDQRCNLCALGADIGIVRRNMAAVVKGVPAATSQQEARGKAEQHLLAARVGDLDGCSLGWGRFYLLAFALQHFLGITFGHGHFSERVIGPAEKPPPRARISWTSRVKERDSSWATARRAFTTLSSAVSTVR